MTNSFLAASLAATLLALTACTSSAEPPPSIVLIVSATVLRLANVPRGDMDGRSLLPLLREENDLRWTGVLEIEGQ